MKATNILKKIYKNNPDIRVQRNNVDINFTIHNFNDISEAIKELEELENRSCSNCNNFKIFNSKVVRDSCSIVNVSDIGGCGKYFEPKKG